MCTLNSPEANYKLSTSEEKIKQRNAYKQNTKQGNLYNSIIIIIIIIKV
jgi:hypothetical protein